MTTADKVTFASRGNAVAMAGNTERDRGRRRGGQILNYGVKRVKEI